MTTLNFDLELDLLSEEQSHEVEDTGVKVGFHVGFLLNHMQQPS